MNSIVEVSASNTVDIIINGEEVSVEKGINLVELLDYLSMPAQKVAIENNLELIPRSNWSTTKLKQNDKLEIVNFVGGG